LKKAMSKKSISPILTWLQIIMSVVIIVLLIRLQIDANIAFRRIELTRAVASGRTRQDVIQWLGQPDSIEKDITINGKHKHSMMFYSGNPFSNGRKNGNEDVAILLDENERIVTSYFESPTDKMNLKRILSSGSEN